MLMLMYVVRDSASGVYDRPMVARSEGEMLRGFADIANDKNHPVGKHPEHYSLWNVGTYQDNTGMVEGQEPIHVVNGIDLVEKAVTVKELRDSPMEHKTSTELLKGVN